MEDIREIEVFLSRDVGQVSLGFVHSLGQAKLSQVFLEKTGLLQLKGCWLICLYHNLILLHTVIYEIADIYLQVVADIH